MAAPNFNAERAARILVDAAYSGDRQAAQKWGVSDRSIRNYRQRLEADSEFAALFHIAKAERESRWADELTDPILAAAGFIRRACGEADPTNPAVLMAVNDSLRVLAEIKATKEMLDARLAPEGRALPAAAGPMGPGAHGYA